MNKTYILIHPDEKGDCVDFLDQKELDDLLDNPIEERGVRHFITMKELEAMDKKNDYTALNPMYWEEDVALLLEYSVLEVRPVVTKYEVKPK